MCAGDIGWPALDYARRSLELPENDYETLKSALLAFREVADAHYEVTDRKHLRIIPNTA
jgi:hypothetical protein